MSSETRREALAVLADLCEKSPEIRLGQLLAHLGFLCEDQAGMSLWDVDDDRLLSVFHRHQAELAGRKSSIDEDRRSMSEQELTKSPS